MSKILIALAFIAAIFAGREWLNRKRRRDLLAMPLDDQERKNLGDRFPLYEKLPADLRQKLDGKINLFLDQVTFHGMDEIEVTDEMRLLIAAQACLLIVNKDDRWYDDLRSILVYPGAFKSEQTKRDGAIETKSQITRIGESWQSGPVVLSWAHAKRGAFIDDDGHNVVLHEFAHQLDDQTGDTSGAPILDDAQNAEEWATVFREADARLKADIAAGRKPFLDPYGATAYAEFFAVAVEVFFERPKDMQREEARLYDQLVQYFELDPASWQ